MTRPDSKQLLFKDLDQAFICTMELRRVSLRESPSVASSLSQPSMGQQGQGLSRLEGDQSLDRLHEKLMFLARDGHYPEALVVIQKMLDLVTQELGISRDATKLNQSHVGHAVMKSMTLFRFHLLLLKTEAYLHSQTGNLDLAKISLEKVLEFDGSNRLGARELLESLPKLLNS